MKLTSLIPWRVLNQDSDHSRRPGAGLECAETCLRRYQLWLSPACVYVCVFVCMYVHACVEVSAMIEPRFYSMWFWHEYV